jgi:hypothetical protein
VNRRFGGTSGSVSYPLPVFVSCLVYFSTLKTEAKCSSETYVDSTDYSTVISQKKELSESPLYDPEILQEDLAFGPNLGPPKYDESQTDF